MIVSFSWWRCALEQRRVARLELPAAPGLEDLAASEKSGWPSSTTQPSAWNVARCASITAVTRGSMGRPPRSRLQATRTPAKLAVEGGAKALAGLVDGDGRARIGAGDGARAAARRPRPCAPSGPRRRGAQPSSLGHVGTRPGEGRKPTTLQKLAGLRSEPPMSLPSAIGTMPRGERHRGAAARAAARLGRVIGVERPAEDLVERLRAGAELGRIGLADRDGAGRLDALDDQPVVLRHVVLVDRRAPRGAETARRHEVLVRDGQAEQRAAVLAAGERGVGGAGLVERLAPRARVTMAFTFGFTRSIWARWACSTSVTEARRERIRSRSAIAVWKQRSLMRPLGQESGGGSGRR